MRSTLLASKYSTGRQEFQMGHTHLELGKRCEKVDGEQVRMNRFSINQSIHIKLTKEYITDTSLGTVSVYFFVHPNFNTRTVQSVCLWFALIFILCLKWQEWELIFGIFKIRIDPTVYQRDMLHRTHEWWIYSIELVWKDEWLIRRSHQSFAKKECR